jgi:formamidopyrimidine-DNA glycosylase
MSDILSVVGSTVAVAGSIFEFLKTIKNPALQLNISNLKRLLAETQTMVADLISENRQLKEALYQDQNDPLSFDKTSGFYVDRENHNYCPACYEEKKMRSHLRKKTFDIAEPWFCPVCRQNYSGHLS